MQQIYGFIYDLGHLDDGTVTVGTALTGKRFKVQVKKDRNLIYYDVEKGYNIEVPCQFGGGIYKLSLYKQTEKNEYKLETSIKINVTDEQAQKYMLSPNVYVNYAEWPTLMISESSPMESFDAIRNYIRQNYLYDYVRATIVKSNTLPDIPYCIKNKRGICQDLAALAVAMCRTANIPARLIIGHADTHYHAWLEVIIDDKTILYDPTAEALHKEIKNYENERWY